MKVLIGVDGSPLSLDAVRVVGHIIDPTEDQVAIYFSPTELQQRLPESSSSLVSRSAADLFAEARALLPTEFAKPVEMISSSASAAVGILESANGWHADLVAVGARSHGSIERFLLGSVSRAVLHGAHLPVLIKHILAREQTQVLANKHIPTAMPRVFGALAELGATQSRGEKYT